MKPASIFGIIFSLIHVWSVVNLIRLFSNFITFMVKIKQLVNLLAMVGQLEKYKKKLINALFCVQIVIGG